MEDNKALPGPDDERNESPDVEIILPKKRTKTQLSQRYDNPMDYLPTITEQKLVRVMLDPFHRMSSVTKICELAGISRESYYRAFRNEQFVDYYLASTKEIAKSQAAPLLNIAIREAKKGGAAGFQYWKALAQMSGLIEDEKLQVNHLHEGDVTMRVEFVGPNEEEEDEND
jgi:DNA-binding phage protein